MAVKQNSDATDAPAAGTANVGGDALEVPEASSQMAAQTAPTVAREAGGGGGGAAAAVGLTERQREMRNLVRHIESIDPDDRHAMFRCCNHVIRRLARVQLRADAPEDIRLFKEEIEQVGLAMAQNTKKEYLMLYLRIVYDLISQGSYEPPSCAVAIVFQLFSPDLIIEAVQSLLDLNVLDVSIRKTMAMLCNWLRVCNFCNNLNLWIMALLHGLREQEKYVLLDNIALDNIEKLFFLMRFPALRPKVAPIVFHMLSTINETPEIFHKILPSIGIIINHIKSQSNSMNESSQESRNYIQRLVDLVNALMLRFYENEELYEPVKLAIQMYEPSQNCVDLARAFFENGLPRNTRVGLVNLGNTCYMNSVLQALAMTTDFARQMMLIESSSRLLQQMQQQLALMHHSKRCQLTPSHVLKATRPPSFLPGVQQDSSEFLGYLLDLLHEQEIGGFGGGGSAKILQEESIDSTTNTSMTDEIVAAGVIPYNSKDYELCRTTPATPMSMSMPTNASMKQKSPPPPSTIDKTFAGKQLITYKCLSCAWESRNEDSFRELQLSFPDTDPDPDKCGSNYSVQDLIDYYCTPEQLNGDNQYYCGRCKKLCDAERRIGFTQAPRNLILTLKQFKYDQKQHFRTKLLHKVFHDESVVVKVCGNGDLLEETCAVHYDLYAGVVHAGFSMDMGHYFTFAADHGKNWFKFNDSHVTSSQPQEMHSLTSPNTPYILFYQMCGQSTDAMVVPVPVPLIPPLTLDELPRNLRDYVKQDNREYSEELRLQRTNAKRSTASNNGGINRGHGGGGYDTDDDDDDRSPAANGRCGSNELGMNINRFVY